MLYIFSAEPPSLTAQPQRKIFAELDRNVDIPCLATGTRRMCVLLYTYLEHWFANVQEYLKTVLTCLYVH